MGRELRSGKLLVADRPCDITRTISILFAESTASVLLCSYPDTTIQYPGYWPSLPQQPTNIEDCTNHLSLLKVLCMT